MNLLALTRVFLRPIFAATAVALIARTLFVQVYAIPSASMVPTLQPGDQIVVTPYRLPWRVSDPRRGEVVVFRRGGAPAAFFVKRVIAVPGDHLEMRQGRVLIDGRTLAEPYRLDDSANGELAPEIVPAGFYFVMGDHREDSIDSREWGFVPRSSVVGRARLIFWSAGGRSGRPSANAVTARRSSDSRDWIRWNRILTTIR
jgi:signal peptidase I